MPAKNDREREVDQLVSRRQLLQRLGRYSVVAAGALVASRASASDDDLLLLLSGALSSIKPIFIEDFETGNFNKNPWADYSCQGIPMWGISSDNKHSGTFSACSGTAVDNNILEMDNVPLPDCIVSFWCSMSCSSDSSLTFQISGETVLKIYGESGWTKYSFEVAAGSRTFAWFYRQGSSSSGSNCAWIDDIIITPKVRGGPWVGDWSGNWTGDWCGDWTGQWSGQHSDHFNHYDWGVNWWNSW